MLTTIHNEEMVPGRRLAAHHKPRCIADYNKYMGGVDHTDQLMQPYDMARKFPQMVQESGMSFSAACHAK